MVKSEKKRVEHGNSGYYQRCHDRVTTGISGDSRRKRQGSDQKQTQVPGKGQEGPLYA